jgi:ERCC4-type nuclease
VNKINILISDAEQLPYTFDNLTTKRVHLETGDYQIEGFSGFCVERKSLEDYTRSVTKEGERFFKEIKRMEKFTAKYIIVEGNLTQLLEHRYSTEIEPNYILSLTYNIIVMHSIPVFFFETRQTALYFVENLILYYVEKHGKKEVKSKKQYTKRNSKEIIL